MHPCIPKEIPEHFIDVCARRFGSIGPGRTRVRESKSMEYGAAWRGMARGSVGLVGVSSKATAHGPMVDVRGWGGGGGGGGGGGPPPPPPPLSLPNFPWLPLPGCSPPPLLLLHQEAERSFQLVTLYAFSRNSIIIEHT